MRKWVYLAAAIGTEVTGTLALRAANDHPGWIILVTAGYILSFIFLAVTLRLGMPIGVAYGIWSAAGVTLTAILAVILFGDPLTGLMGLGFVVIIAGVLLVELGSHPAARPEPQPAPTGPAGAR